MVQATVFDSSDGVTSHAGISRFDFGHFRPGGYTPQVARSSDGKLWFSPGDGVSVVDPHHLPFNKLPPPVQIEQITADRKTYDPASAVGGRLPLPARVRDLQIDYTALSLVVSEKVLFRYKLEGLDSDWQDAGNRRQAFYTNLPPRKYRFRVMACNNSGVWNEDGASFDFSIAPAYYQTWWFRLSCAVAFLALLWGLYKLRLRRVGKEFNMRLDERVNERTRIARELHDTLLQSFQGVLLFFQAGVDQLPDLANARKTLQSAVDRAQEAISEGREAVQGLRSSTTNTNELAAALSTFGKELATKQTNEDCPVLEIEVEGEPQDLHPILRDEVYRVASEAMRNSFRHAKARRIEVEIQYDERRLRVLVRDDGKGIEPQVLADKGRAGHYGLHGMHERAKLAGGHLEVWSKPNCGTEIELTIPASRAYATSQALRLSWFSRKGNALKS
jgi:signal transduction histidine kinase